MENNIGKQIKEISEAINDKELLANASNEELMSYLFLVEKMKQKLEKMVDMEK